MQGDRFGGALDGAASMFTEAFDSGLIPMEFVNKTRKEGKLIMGIGHRVKSINNPDKRVSLVKEFAKENFPKTPLLDYALATESITTSKKPNLILNVDGCIAVCFVDLLRHRSVWFLCVSGSKFYEHCIHVVMFKGFLGYCAVLRPTNFSLPELFFFSDLSLRKTY